ncbi:unnamed protein product [Pleuronectes platessa]|uniref:Uncharacterized protein n=1 Tax=Pleuronectes platessa TaxID=8262 RepID=A0A9N7UL92_PLEPL|nr:unnamed protein product [Pleuronectes platessa]
MLPVPGAAPETGVVFQDPCLVMGGTRALLPPNDKPKVGVLCAEEPRFRAHLHHGTRRRTRENGRKRAASWSIAPGRASVSAAAQEEEEEEKEEEAAAAYPEAP